MKAILLTGMPASRKSSFAELLSNALGWRIVPLSAKLHEYFNISSDQSLKVPDNRRLSNQIRSELGQDALAQLTLRGCSEHAEMIIDGVRSWAEVVAFRKAMRDCILVAVVCPLEARRLRYKQRHPELFDAASALVQQDESDLLLGMGDVIARAEIYAYHDGSIASLKDQANELSRTVMSSSS